MGNFSRNIFVSAVIGIAFGTIPGGAAVAQSLSRSTPCRTISSAVDTNDAQKVLPILKYAIKAFDELDIKNIKLGNVPIMPPMTSDGKSGLVAMVSVHCRANPAETFGSSIDFVYDGVRGMQEDVGLIPMRKE